MVEPAAVTMSEIEVGKLYFKLRKDRISFIPLRCIKTGRCNFKPAALVRNLFTNQEAVIISARSVYRSVDDVMRICVHNLGKWFASTTENPVKVSPALLFANQKTFYESLYSNYEKACEFELIDAEVEALDRSNKLLKLELQVDNSIPQSESKST